MQTSFRLPTSDGPAIHGLLNTADDFSPAKKLLIVSHGFACRLQEYMYERAVRFFNEQSYDVVRFGYYGEEPDARKLNQCDLSTHAKDLRSVTDHFVSQYQDVFVAGHSFGGLVALMANPPGVRALTLWDSSFHPDTRFEEDDASYNATLRAFLYHSFVDIVTSPAMVNQANSLTPAYLDSLATQIKTPAQFLFSSDGPPCDSVGSFLNAFHAPKEMSVIPDSDHFFTLGNSADRLMAKSLMWFREHTPTRPTQTQGARPENRPGVT